MDDDFCSTAYVWYFMSIAVDRHFNIPTEVSTNIQTEVSKMNEWFYDKLLSKIVNSSVSENAIFPIQQCCKNQGHQCWWFHFKCENGSSSVGKGRLKICSNADCGSNENLCFAPYFVCAYYGLRVERSNTRRVCQRCYREAENHQSILVNMLRDHKSIILGPKKPKNQMVTIDDEECSEDSMGSPEEVEIEEGIEDLVKCLVEKYKFEEQVDDTLKHLGKSEV